MEIIEGVIDLLILLAFIFIFVPSMYSLSVYLNKRFKQFLRSKKLKDENK